MICSEVCLWQRLANIEWTDATWNPVRGCTKVSPGCKHCYAETFAERFRGVPGHPFEQGFDLRLVPDKLDEPFRWAGSRRVFVNSMSDLFHEAVPDDFIMRVFSVMRRADWHIYQVLTKRPERMREIVARAAWVARCPHIWLGVSVEDRAYGLPRLDVLRETKAAVRFYRSSPSLKTGRLVLLGGHRLGHRRRRERTRRATDAGGLGPSNPRRLSCTGDIPSSSSNGGVRAPNREGASSTDSSGTNSRRRLPAAAKSPLNEQETKRQKRWSLGGRKTRSAQPSS